MNKKISSSIIKAIAAGIVLLLLMFANSAMMNDSYAAKKSTPAQNESTLPTPALLPIPPPSGLLGTLKVITKVWGGNNKPSDFTITVSGKSPKPAS